MTANGSIDDIPVDARTLLDIALEGEDEKTKLKIYRLLQQVDIQPRDPMFLAIAAVTHAKFAIAPIPGDLNTLIGEIKLHLGYIQSLSRRQIEDCHDVARDIKVIAQRLSKQMAQHASSGTSPVSSFLWAFFGAVTGSVLIFVLQRFL
ncbi:hypothetical protein [Phormidium tenue]|uniref:Uncharacterized protein n=1 Tax=Phormidium tenue NIES-30 TaxID=549789 RepID=A0A1U7J7Q8_9CYAN|nr:hypothetical protein [Phormidium tenue]MBD2231489.1 hypothetical protein [Phormidium tenue FACHB-1052]OKH49119.1 hypothetical protein NIES30_08120 [Phormidium tenue NIES-30]